MKKLYYIKNTINEYGSSIRGYYSSLKKAKEALKDCQDWYRSKGTGSIYAVDLNTANPVETLVFKN